MAPFARHFPRTQNKLCCKSDIDKLVPWLALRVVSQYLYKRCRKSIFCLNYLLSCINMRVVARGHRHSFHDVVTYTRVSNVRRENPNSRKLAASAAGRKRNRTMRKSTVRRLITQIIHFIVVLFRAPACSR